VLKRLVKNFVGKNAWFRLTQFRIEFKLRSLEEFWDPELGDVLKKVLPDNGFYVDVGAHDGRTSSNTFYLEVSGWTGILIEPILSKYFRIRQIRSLTSNKVFHAACVPTDYSKDSVCMVYADLMSFSEDLSTVDKESWVDGAREFLNSNEDTVKTYCPARTLNSILTESDAPSNIDFLSIDVEGAEQAVLEGLDLSYFSFAVICIEAQSETSIYKLIGDPNYNLHSQVKNNYVFLHRSYAP